MSDTIPQSIVELTDFLLVGSGSTTYPIVSGTRIPIADSIVAATKVAMNPDRCLADIIAAATAHSLSEGASKRIVLEAMQLIAANAIIAVRRLEAGEEL